MSSTQAVGAGHHFAWARHRSRGELLDLVLEIEDRLRRLVRGVLQGQHPDWESLIPDSIRSKIVPRKLGMSDLLDGASLAQLIGVVLNRWDLFGELMGGDETEFRVKADEFREWRNALAHGKTPSDDEKVSIASVVSQVGRHVPAPAESTHPPGESVRGSALLWVDDRPEGNLRERQIFRMLGIGVVPAISNDEALEIARSRTFDLIISDIDRAGAEPGDKLPGRCLAIGVTAPILFYVGVVDSARGRPPGAADIFDDPARLVQFTLKLLTHRPRVDK